MFNGEMHLPLKTPDCTPLCLLNIDQRAPARVPHDKVHCRLMRAICLASRQQSKKLELRATIGSQGPTDQRFFRSCVNLPSSPQSGTCLCLCTWMAGGLEIVGF